MPLTHDHHHALAHVRHLRLAADGDAQELLKQSQGFLDFFHEDTLNHFREEEEIVFPLAIGDERASELLSHERSWSTSRFTPWWLGSRSR